MFIFLFRMNSIEPICIRDFASFITKLQKKHTHEEMEFLQTKNGGLCIRRVGEVNKNVPVLGFVWESETGCPFLPDTDPVSIVHNQKEREQRWGIDNNKIVGLLCYCSKDSVWYEVCREIYIGLRSKTELKTFETQYLCQEIKTAQ